MYGSIGSDGEPEAGNGRTPRHSRSSLFREKLATIKAFWAPFFAAEGLRYWGLPGADRRTHLLAACELRLVYGADVRVTETRYGRYPKYRT